MPSSNETLKPNLIIDVENIIVNLLVNDRKLYVDIDRLTNLCNYIKEQLIEKRYLEKYQSVIFDVNFNSIHRTVMCKNSLFQLIGERIYLKEAISDEAALRYEREDITALIKSFITAEVA